MSPRERLPHRTQIFHSNCSVPSLNPPPLLQSHTTTPSQEPRWWTGQWGWCGEVCRLIQGSLTLRKAGGLPTFSEAEIHQNTHVRMYAENHSGQREDTALLPPTLPSPPYLTLHCPCPRLLLLESKEKAEVRLAGVCVSMTGGAPWLSRVLPSWPLFPSTSVPETQWPGSFLHAPDCLSCTPIIQAHIKV